MIIGLGYRARSGKDTAASYIVEHFDNFRSTAFAESLKNACYEIFGLNKEQMYGSEKEVVDPFWKDTPRNILQKVGTECLRQGYSHDVWVRSLERRVRGYGARAMNWVITDVRFPNEADAIKSWGGKLVRVDRANLPEIATSSHASETSMQEYKGWDYVLENNHDLPQLYAHIELMMRALRT